MILDGDPVKSCLVLAIAVDGSVVTTIEGLERDGQLHPLQKAFVARGALQCGFCTPGMVLASKALIDRNPDPTVQEIKEALGGNLCRCGSYQRIIDAIRHWREYAGEDEPARLLGEGSGAHRVVGQSHPRSDGPDKVTGRAVFTEDIQLSGMLHGKVLSSPHAHARVRGIDTSEAEALPGVKAVITGKDVSDVRYGVSPARYDEQVLARDKVRFVGDEVAAVAAVDEATAERAIQLIRVDYEKLPAVLDPFEAMRDGAPVIHEAARQKNNVNTQVDHHFGDVEKGSPRRTRSWSGASAATSPTSRPSSRTAPSRSGITTPATSPFGRRRRCRTTCSTRWPGCWNCPWPGSASSSRSWEAGSEARPRPWRWTSARPTWPASPGAR